MAEIQEKVQELLEDADIKINGNRPWDIQVKNDNLYSRVMRQGSLGLGEAYMDKWWDAEALDEFFYRVLKAGLQEKFFSTLPAIWSNVKSLLLNLQTEKRAYEVGETHYDIGNDLYKAMLDKNMVYTCGYWNRASNLDEAQEAKLGLVCQSLNLHSGERVLDIGCGWGSFAKFAAENYGAKVVGVTVSKQQAQLAGERCEGLPVEIRLQDYRKLEEQFDHVVSLGMFEHVGSKNYRTYMRLVAKCLKDSGRFVLHTIGSNVSVHTTDPWIEKYIFPNSMLPSIRQIGLAIEGLFVMEDWGNYGTDYDKTLMAWYKNFTNHWEKLSSHYSERFFRMWEYYLMCSAGSFRARKNQQWQIILTKRGLPEVIHSHRPEKRISAKAVK